MKTYIRIAKISLPILIDTEASVYIISEDLVKKFRLKIEANDEIKVASLGKESKVRVIDLISNAPIVVQNFRTPELLYVMGGTESVIILETDWIDQY